MVKQEVLYVSACAVLWRTRSRCLEMGNGRETAGSLFSLSEEDRNRESKTKRESRGEERQCFEALALEMCPCNVTSYCLHGAHITLPQSDRQASQLHSGQQAMMEKAKSSPLSRDILKTVLLNIQLLNGLYS